MSIERAIYGALRADAAVTALVGGRVFPSYVPRGESMPAVTYQGISGIDEVTTDPATGLREERWQITCWADTHDECVALYAAVKALFERYGGTVAGVTIHETYIASRGDVPDASDAAGNWKGFGKFVDVVFSYME